MTQEIELKFIVNNDAVDALRECLDTSGGEHHASSQLLNIYYEAPGAWLCGHDMGLRIHGENGHYEMIMEIAGRVTGGLHRRPEYNVALNAPELDLTLSPTEAWLDGELLAEFTSRIQPLFSTDLYREKWLVDVDGSRVEMALGLGEVRASEFAEPICEPEFELLSGDIRAVLKLTNQLVSQTGLCQGSLSKAARGHHPAQGDAPRGLKPTRISKVPAKASIEQGLEVTLELALSWWQYHEELWVRDVKGVKAEVLAAMGLMRRIPMLFGGNVPREAGTHLRGSLTQSEVIILSDVSAVSTVYGTQTATVKLVLTEWLVTKGWQPFFDAKVQGKIADSSKRFSDTHFSRHAAELKTAFAQPLGDQYVGQFPRSTRNIDSIPMLVGYYDENVASEWIANWQGLHHAITANQYIETEHFRNEAIALEPFWLHSGER